MFAITVAGNVAAFTAEGTTIVVRRNRATKSIRVSLWDGRERWADPRNRTFAADAAGAQAAREYVAQIADESVTASKKWWCVVGPESFDNRQISLVLATWRPHDERNPIF